MEIKQELHQNDLCCHTPSFAAEHHFFHWHENYEICRVENKPCSFRIDGKLFKAEVGDIVVILPHTVHQFIIESDDTKITILHFPLKALLGLGENVKPLERLIPYANLDENFKEKLNTLFSILLKEGADITEENSLYFEMIAASLHALLQCKFSTDDVGNKKHRDLFLKMSEYISTHYKEEINLNCVSRALDIPRNKASDLFKRYGGIGINDYINTLRIEFANELMKSGSTVSEAAFSSGFSCIRTFNNVYKSIMKLSPTEFLNE